jgi:hypothetical protein
VETNSIDEILALGIVGPLIIDIVLILTRLDSQVAQHADVSLYLGLIDKEQSLQVRQMANDVIDLIDK